MKKVLALALTLALVAFVSTSALANSIVIDGIINDGAIAINQTTNKNDNIVVQVAYIGALVYQTSNGTWWPAVEYVDGDGHRVETQFVNIPNLWIPVQISIPEGSICLLYLPTWKENGQVHEEYDNYLMLLDQPGVYEFEVKQGKISIWPSGPVDHIFHENEFQRILYKERKNGYVNTGITKNLGNKIPDGMVSYCEVITGPTTTQP